MADATVPIPDPTLLTTEQQARGLTNLRELLETRLIAVEQSNRHQFDDLRRVPTDTDRQVAHLKELLNEKFNSVQKQFDERDIRSQASEDAAKVAVNAALQAQKEAAAAQNESNAAAITKSEGATVKQIDGILALLASNTMAINDKIASNISRLDRGEAIITANSLSRQDRRQDGGANVAILGVGLLVITVVVGLAGFVIVRP